VSWITTKLLAYVAGGLLAALIAVALGQELRVQSAKAEAADARRDHADALVDIAQLRTDLADQLAQFERDARRKVLEQSKALAAVAEHYEKEKDDALSRADALVADLRAGTRRLRDEWAACETSARVSGTVAAAAQPDAATDVRAAGIGRVLRIVAACETHVRGLQGVVRTYAGATQ
jgi:hypothetical protein